jgi:hypothetical protein
MTLDVTRDPATNGGATEHARRLAGLVTRMQRRGRMIGRLSRLVQELETSRLATVAGDRLLVTEALRRLAELHRTVDALERIPPENLAAELDRLEAALVSEAWQLLEESLGRLTALRGAVQEAIAGYREQLTVWRFRVDRRAKALAQARDQGAVVLHHAIVVAELDGLLREAERDAAAGRFDTVAVALHRLDAVKDPAVEPAPCPQPPGDRADPADQAALDDAGFIGALEQAGERASLLGNRAELMIMAGNPGADNTIEYVIMLRMPASVLQEVHLQASSILVRQDRDALNWIVNQVTREISSGIRSLRSQPRTTAGVVDQPPPTAAGPPAGLRSFVPDEEAPSGLAQPDPEAALRSAGYFMYSLFVPDTMQRLVADAEYSLTIATDDLELPWELMHDGEEFLCLGQPVTRMPLGRAFPRRRRLSLPVQGDRVRALFVAADPAGDLPGAVDEVHAVTSALERRWGSSLRIELLEGPDASGRRLNEELRSGAYQLVHYAGHAAFDRRNPERSALLLHDRELFFAQKVQRILEGRPLVFLNACETSTTANEEADPATTYIAAEAQGLAAAFIYGGASACVGSLWPVYDDTAALFAIAFYDALFEGNRIGEALRLARRRVRERHRDRVTWASYALYGDPTVRLPILPVARQDLTAQGGA